MSKKKLKFLDCTLRDGGYYTDWDFEQEVVDTYLKSVEKLPIDIIEVGYRNNPHKEYLGEFFYLPTETLKKVKNLAPSKKVAIMFNEKAILPKDSEKLLKSAIGKIDIVRLAVDPKRFDRALVLAKSIKKQGFEVALNLMYTSKWMHDKSVIKKLPKMNGIVDYFSIVDSYGGMSPEEVRKVVTDVKKKLNMKLGFHGHNNMELAFANSLVAIEAGCEVIDGTMTGIGRGAGNMRTELFLSWASVKLGLKVDFDILSNVVSQFEQMKEKYQWGTYLPYIVSGISSLPQKDVMDWVTKRLYSMNSIMYALENKRTRGKNNIKIPRIKKSEKYSKVLLVAGGPNAVHNKDAIKRWIHKNKKDILLIHVSARNAKYYKDIDVPQFVCLIGNEGQRLESMIEEVNPNLRCILPPSPREMGEYIPAEMKDKTHELSDVKFTKKYKDSGTAVAIQLSIDMGAKHLYTAGYDGYSGPQIAKKDHEVSKENDYLFETYTKNIGIIHTLTPSDCTLLKAYSVYGDID
ncbi:aldolase catalytic domain-containing protein [Patescibacteria group bacterium]|nr:aldolase catalytic domain-containing protein [Patescibacteria group bacterium]